MTERLPMLERDALRAELTRWYRAERRALPWRRDRDPYRVWISEAMLQQTRVETVVPYFERFLARFPDVHALAAAREEEVLALWSGLGYYSRARKLHAAARVIVTEHAGEFPRARAAALGLPGVGPYTAGAVLSIAYDLAEPLVDGNVVRVLCRLLELDGDPSAAPLARELWEIAAELVPSGGGAGEWNQALMELGATVCTPRAPRCLLCPWRARCAARAAGRAEELPQLRARRAAVAVELRMFLARRAGELLLARRPAGGRMAGLLELPTLELAPEGSAPTGLFPAAFEPSPGRVDPFELGPELAQLRHTITHHRIRARVHAAELRAGAALAAFEWHALAALDALELTGMTRKALRAALTR